MIQFIEFKRLSKLYWKQHKEKGKHLKGEIILTSYRAYIKDDDLKIFIAAGWVDYSSIDELMKRKIRQCMEETRKKKAKGENLYLVDKKIKTAEMQMHIYTPEDQVWSLRRTYAQALRAAGYGELVESKALTTINHFLKRRKPPQLYRRTVNMMTWIKNEIFHKKNFGHFVRKVSIQAKKI